MELSKYELNENVNLNIGHSPDELGVDEAISTYRDAKNGYTFAISDIAFKAQDFEKMLEAFKEEFHGIKEYDYSMSKNNIFKKFRSERFICYVRGNSIDQFGSFYTKSEEDSKIAWDIYKKYDKDEEDIQMYMGHYSMNGNKAEENTKIIKRADVEYINEKYYPYIDTDILFNQFFTNDENVLLLVGAPGIGKSKFATLMLKYSFENNDKLPYDKLQLSPGLDQQFITAAYVKSNDVLASDSFWKNLENNPPDFCIVDDLDYMLTKRDAEVTSSDDMIKNSFLNQFLSYTDGVEKHKTKFVITTNQKYDDIDTALLRKGRLFDILELRKLDKDEALEIWEENKLDKDEFYKVFTTHEILPAELGSEISKRLNTRIENSTAPYLKEEGISKIQRAGRDKKIGL